MSLILPRLACLSLLSHHHCRLGTETSSKDSTQSSRPLLRARPRLSLRPSRTSNICTVNSTISSSIPTVACMKAASRRSWKKPSTPTRRIPSIGRTWPSGTKRSVTLQNRCHRKRMHMHIHKRHCILLLLLPSSSSSSSRSQCTSSHTQDITHTCMI